MATFVRAPNQFSSLLKEKIHVFVTKIKIPQENTKMMHRYSLSSNNMMQFIEIKLILARLQNTRPLAIQITQPPFHWIRGYAVK